MTSLVGRLPRTLHPSSSMTMANDDEDELALLSEDDIMLGSHSQPRPSSSQSPYTSSSTSKQKGKAPSSAGSSKGPREESVSKENVWVAIADLRNNYCGVQDELMEYEKRLSAVEAYPEAFEEMVESAMNTLHARIADDLAEVRDQGTREDKSGMQGLLKQVEEVQKLVEGFRNDRRHSTDRNLEAAVDALQEKVETLERGKQRIEGEAEEAERVRAEEKQEQEALKKRLKEAEQILRNEKEKYDRAIQNYREKQEEMQKKLDQAAKERQEWATKMEVMMAKLELRLAAAAAPIQHVVTTVKAASRSQQHTTQEHRFSQPLFTDKDVQRRIDLSSSTRSMGSLPRSPLEESSARTTVMDIEYNDFINDTGEYTDNRAVQQMPERPLTPSACPAPASHNGSESDVDNDFALGTKYPAEIVRIDGNEGCATQDQLLPTIATDIEDTSDESHIRLQTPTQGEPLPLPVVTQMQRSSRKRTSRSASITNHRSVRESTDEAYVPRGRLTSGRTSSASRAKATARETARRSVGTPKHAAPRQAAAKKKKRIDTGPKWRMNVTTLRASGGIPKGEGEWPVKVEYTIKGRAQEIICDVCKGRVHWFCAGLQDDDPAPEGEWHCPDCKHKMASGTLRHTIEPAEQTKCLRANCLLRAKVKTVRKEDDDKQYYPEEIIGRRAISRNEDKSRNFEYLIKWAEWDVITSTWEPPSNFKGQEYMIDQFMKEIDTLGIRTKPRVNLLPAADTFFDGMTGELKDEYAESHEGEQEIQGQADQATPGVIDMTEEADSRQAEKQNGMGNSEPITTQS